MKKNIHKGFTLIEMLAVLGIFSVLSTVVIFNYNKFTSDTILTNMAYEVALSLREAQIYGISSRNPDGGNVDFSKAYGTYFPYLAGGVNSYVLFADEDDDKQYAGTTCDTPNSDTCVTPYTLQRQTLITQLRTNCVVTTTGLSVAFKRPNPEAVINGDFNTGTADIELTAPSGTKRYVVVRNNGQIYVTNTEPTCSS